MVKLQARGLFLIEEKMTASSEKTGKKGKSGYVAG